MNTDWVMHQHYYNKAKDNNISIMGERRHKRISLKDRSPSDIGVSGGRIDVEITEVSESFELHVWGYRMNIKIKCDSDVSIPIYIHSTTRSATELPEHAREAIDKARKNNDKNTKFVKETMKEQYEEKVEKEATSRVNITIVGGTPNVKKDATNNTSHGGHHSMVESY